LILNASATVSGDFIKRSIATAIDFVTPTTALILGGLVGGLVGLFIYHLVNFPGELTDVLFSLPRFFSGDPAFDISIAVRWGLVYPIGQITLAILAAVALGSGSGLGPRIGVLVRGFRGAFVVGFLSPWFAYDWFTGFASALGGNG
jgi:hypothetical protein